MSIVYSHNVSDMNVELIHRFLSEQSTWSVGIQRETVETAMENSLCFGVFLNDEQVGFARVITDRATFANLVDVFVLPEHRGKGLAKGLMNEVMAHPDLQGLRRFTLATSDMHPLYRQFGFTDLAKPCTFMEIYRPDIYRR